MSVGTPEIIIIAALVLMLFGPSRMPEILRAFGRVTREIRKAVLEVQTEIEDAARSDDSQKTDPKR